jgi:hypothetical protein
MTDVIVPTLNINGTDAKELIWQLQNAVDAIAPLRLALRVATPMAGITGRRGRLHPRPRAALRPGLEAVTQIESALLKITSGIFSQVR